MFRSALKLDNEPMALTLAHKFESVMIRSANSVVPSILARFRRENGFNEIMLHALQQMQPSFHFMHADELIEILEEYKDKIFRREGFVIASTNPLMIMVILTEILQKTKEQFRSLALRIQFILDSLHEQLIPVL